MPGKSLAYWRKKYEISNYRQEDYKNNNEIDTGLEAAWKTLDLLSQYSAFYKTLPFIGLPVAWGGSIGRFFSCRFNTHHGNEIQNAIDNFYHMDGYYASTERFQTVEFILALVKKSLCNKDISPNGDLARILQVVKDKTGVNYFTLDENSIYKKYRNT